MSFNNIHIMFNKYYESILNNIYDYFIRLIMLYVFYKIWILSQNFINYKNDFNKFVDRSHTTTSVIHKILKNNMIITKSSFIISSLIIDTIMSLIIIDYIFYNNSIEIKILLYTMIIRQINQCIISFPKPEEILWTNPGFPSIFVTYEVTNDFYFSGHTSLAVISGMFLQRYGYIILGQINIVFQISLLIFTRSHYFPDIITGFIIPYFIKYMMEL